MIADEFDLYCAKTIKGKYSKKRRKSICWCVDDNYREQLRSIERQWLVQRALAGGKKNNTKEEEELLVEATQKRLQELEFNIFKNCSTDYKWKGNRDDIGMPDDITKP